MTIDELSAGPRGQRQLVRVGGKGVKVHNDVDNLTCYELYERHWSDDDESAIKELCRRTETKALDLARRVLGTAAGSEDVVQQVWVAMLTTHHRIDTRRFESYFFAAVRHRAFDELRRRKRHPHVPFDELEADGEVAALRRLIGDPSPEDDVVSRLANEQRFERCMRLIDEHNPDWSEALFLRWSGLTNDEIASSLGVSKNCVEQRVSRAYAFLRERMGETTTGDAT